MFTNNDLSLIVDRAYVLARVVIGALMARFCSLADDRNKLLKKKHHSDPGGEKVQLSRVSGSPLSEIMAGSKSEPYLGDYSLEDDDSLAADEDDASRGLRNNKAKITGSQTLPRRETPSRSLSVGGTWARGSHRRYGSDGGDPQTQTSFYPK